MDIHCTMYSYMVQFLHDKNSFRFFLYTMKAPEVNSALYIWYVSYSLQGLEAVRRGKDERIF